MSTQITILSIILAAITTIGLISVIPNFLIQIAIFCIWGVVFILIVRCSNG